MSEPKIFQALQSDGPAPPKYRRPCPEDMALVVVHEGRALVLDHIGSGLSYITDAGMMDDYLDPCCKGVASGVYVWKGRLLSVNHDDPDTYLDGDFRLATKEEWNKHLAGKDIWDPTLWYEDPPPPLVALLNELAKAPGTQLDPKFSKEISEYLSREDFSAVFTFIRNLLDKLVHCNDPDTCGSSGFVISVLNLMLKDAPVETPEEAAARHSELVKDL